MKPIRFIVLFVLNYGLSLLFTYFFVFSAQYLQQSNVLFGAIVLGLMLTAFFSWLYYRAVPALTWRQRTEVMAVWMGLVLLLDLSVLYGLSGGSISDLTLLTPVVYLLQVACLFIAAYLTAGGNHPRISSPNLALPNQNDPQ